MGSIFTKSWIRVEINGVVNEYPNTGFKVIKFSDNDFVKLLDTTYDFGKYPEIIYEVNGNLIVTQMEHQIDASLNYIGSSVFAGMINCGDDYAVLQFPKYNTPYDGAISYKLSDAFDDRFEYYARYSASGWYGEEHHDDADIQIGNRYYVKVTDQYKNGIRDFSWSSTYKGKKSQYILYDGNLIAISGHYTFKNSDGSNVVATGKIGERFGVKNLGSGNRIVTVNGVEFNLASNETIYMSFDESVVKITSEA